MLGISGVEIQSIFDEISTRLDGDFSGTSRAFERFDQSTADLSVNITEDHQISSQNRSINLPIKLQMAKLLLLPRESHRKSVS
jgi:hypothetical protein